MFDQYIHEHQVIDGIFSFDSNKTFTKVSHNYLGEYSINTYNKLIDVIKDEGIPHFLIRHGLGTKGGEEDTSHFHRRKKEDYDFSEERSNALQVAFSEGVLQNLEYSGLKIPLNPGGYSHAVGPIHAGVIEPGHFRFFVRGEEIQHLTIRLGFQKRNIRDLLKNKNPFSAMAISEALSGDTTIGYALAFARIFEKAAEIKVNDDIEMIRLILLEVERCAIHIGDIGAIAGDIGYYPLHGVCATDRGVPLGVMEALVGNRFGKGGIFPGEVRLNKKLEKNSLPVLVENLRKGFQRVEFEFLRAADNSTIRERLQECGKITKNMVRLNGFVGMPARCTGIELDMRKFEDLYQKYYPISFHHDDENLTGDAWARFYLRYLELKTSIDWLSKIITEINPEVSAKGKHLALDIGNIKPGLYFQSIEAWRGPVFVAMELSDKCVVRNSYIRDPSVLNWHALELAVRGELIGDFPLNNKSFNLSYVGFDL